ncbi:hypothetical protein [Loigolactobacillus binensis]|uniref:Uncharacterized protein n=1 Tax=Loigolactobacillus binensis TaxID=2559922 RepID=A0ABW3EAF1_9LACO|nr:hypothetical protein [Loigolactobacillus binensis]
MPLQQYEQSHYLLNALSAYCNTDMLNELLVDQNYGKVKSKTDGLANFIIGLNAETTVERQQIAIKKFNESFLLQYKEKCNHLVGLSYLDLTNSTLNSSLDIFTHSKDVENIQDLNVNNFFNFIPNDRFQIVYRKFTLNEENDRVDQLDIMFGRRFASRDIADADNLRVDFTWVNLNLKTRKAIFRFHSMANNLYEPSKPVAPMISFKIISAYLLHEYNITFHNEDNSKQIFELYKKLTATNEQTYVKLVMDAETENKTSLVDTFYLNMLERLGLESKKDRIYVRDRIFNTFVRLLIINDFDNFKNHVSNMPGSVVSFNYHDLDGSTINGKNGGGMYTIGTARPPMESSTTYFDTKDTIFHAESLQELDVSWRKYNLIHSTRYTAFPNLLTIHFIMKSVREEVLQSVLQDFENLTR